MRSAFLTREGYLKVEHELAYLSTVRRSRVAERLHLASEEARDALESSELEDARNEQACLEGRIRMLRSILRSAIIIQDNVFHGGVGLGCHVTAVARCGDGAPETYRVVASAKADPSSGSISNESPLGRDLVGRGVGERITVAAPEGQMMFRIVDIR